MSKRSQTSAHLWWCIILNAGIFLLLTLTIYGAILRWIKTPYLLNTTQKLLGSSVDALEIILLLLSQLRVVRLSYDIRAGNLFSRSALHNARGAFLYFLIWTIYVPFQRTLETLIATMYNAVGQRLFIVSFGTTDLMRLMVLAILAFLVFVLQRGVDLTEDQSLTI